MEYKHNGKQSEATRMELFIALQYLLEQCPDKKHTSKTLDLQSYSEEKFNVFFDRRRVNPTFDTLVKFTKENPTVLPYKVLQVEGKPRYYIEKTLFNNKEIKAISTAISKDSSLSKAKAKQYVEAFLDKVSNKEDKEKIINDLQKRNQLDKHVSNHVMSLIDYFEELRDSQKRFHFRLKHSPKIVDCTSPIAHRKAFYVTGNRNPNEYAAGIIFELYQFDAKTDACVYLPDEKGAIVVNISDIIIDSTFEPVAQWNTVKFEIEHSKHSSLEEWIDDYYKGNTGFQLNIKFKFYIGDNEENLRKYSKSYREFFKRAMEYETVERESRVGYNEDGTEMTRTVTDAVTSITCNFSAFKKWYWEYGGYENIVILEPRQLNNRLLDAYIARFQRRVEKYGISQEEKDRRSLEAERFLAERMARRESQEERVRNVRAHLGNKNRR